MNKGLTSLMKVDAIIVGGGPVGAALANALALKNLKIVVVDIQEPVFKQEQDDRANAIALGSQKFLHSCGVWDQVEEKEPILEIKTSEGLEDFSIDYHHKDLSKDPMGYIVRGSILRRAVYKAACEKENITWKAPVTITSCVRSKNSVRVKLNTDEEIEASLLVAADGRFSKTRQEAGIEVTNWPYPQKGIVCSITHTKSHNNIA